MLLKNAPVHKYLSQYNFSKITICTCAIIMSSISGSGHFPQKIAEFGHTSYSDPYFCFNRSGIIASNFETYCLIGKFKTLLSHKIAINIKLTCFNSYVCVAVTCPTYLCLSHSQISLVSAFAIVGHEIRWRVYQNN